MIDESGNETYPMSEAERKAHAKDCGQFVDFMTFDPVAKKIMGKVLNWTAKEMRDDLRDYPEEHMEMRDWVVRELKKLVKRQVSKAQS